MSFKKVAVAIISLGLLAGCVNQPKAIPFDPVTAPKLKTIGLLTPAMPEHPSADLASSVGQSFGLIGALVDASMKANRDSELTTLLKSNGFDAKKQLTEQIKADLQAAGYKVVDVPVTRENGIQYLASYPTSDNEIDAYLDIVTDAYGYIAAGVAGSTPYRPRMDSRVKLVDARSSGTLMEDRVVYNSLRAGQSDIVTIAPDSAYSFRDFDALMASPENTRKGLDDSIKKSADAIAQLMQ